MTSTENIVRRYAPLGSNFKPLKVSTVGVLCSKCGTSREYNLGFAWVADLFGPVVEKLFSVKHRHINHTQKEDL